MSEPLSFSADAVESIATRLLGQPNRKLSTRRDLRFGRRGSVSVIPARGVFFDNESGAKGGLLDLVVFAGAAKDRREAAQLLEADGDLPLRETEADRYARQLAEAKARAANLTTAAALWKAGQQLQGTAAETYLRSARAVDAPLTAEALRFHPAAPFTPYRPDGRTHPALMAAVVGEAGRFTGLHLTYLRPDGLGKADVTPARKMIGTVGGGHVRLMDGARVVVAEGVESAFSAWDAAFAELGAVGSVGAAAGLSANGVASYCWPRGTVGLVIAHDRDAKGAGERSGRALAARAHAEGLEVSLLPPPEGFSDWNDRAQAMCRAA